MVTGASSWGGRYMSSVRSEPRRLAYTTSFSTRTFILRSAFPQEEPSLHVTAGRSRVGDRVASRTAAHPADENIPGDSAPHPPFLDSVETNGVGQFLGGHIGLLEQTRLPQHLHHLLSAVLHAAALPYEIARPRVPGAVRAAHSLAYWCHSLLVVASEGGSCLRHVCLWHLRGAGVEGDGGVGHESQFDRWARSNSGEGPVGDRSQPVGRQRPDVIPAGDQSRHRP